MSASDDVLEFLRDLPAFARGADAPEVWLAALEQFAEPMLAAAGDFPLREAQVSAWRGLASERAGLILGPPGTGKTHLLAWLVLGYVLACQAAGRPCRVLVSAFTRAAIGNLLDSVAKRVGAYGVELPLVYLGSAPPDGLAGGILHIERTGPAGLKDAVDRIRAPHLVVGASVWTIYKLLHSGRLPGASGMFAPAFDLICIDEASQMPLGHGLIALGALAPAGRVVVAGDNKQLPPIRVSRAVEIEGRNLGGSLYEYLKSAEAREFALEETFRLNEPLTRFPEANFYQGKFRSTDETKARRLPLAQGWASNLTEWERVVLDPDWPICVLVHEGPSAATRNPFEAGIVARLTKVLRASILGESGTAPCDAREFWRERMAVVSPHRAHNQEIAALLSSDGEVPFVETVDRIQGKERDCVILSYCVADPEFALAEAAFIFSPERLNVATTRARSKLIVLISRKLLEATPSDQDALDQAELMREFVASCAPKGKIAVQDAAGRSIGIEVMVSGFDETPVLADLKPEPVAIPAAGMAPALQAVYDAVDQLSLGSSFNNVAFGRLRQHLARDERSVFTDLVSLHHLGWISLQQRSGNNGPWWAAQPFPQPRRVFTHDDPDFALRVEEAIIGARSGRKAPYYDRVRERFAWMTKEGDDQLFRHLQDLAQTGFIRLMSEGGGIRVELAERRRQAEAPDSAALPELSDDDFIVLNALEAIEADQINFGILESWISPQRLADILERPRSAVGLSVGRLVAHGYAMLAEEQRLRSRMGELARELRYVKQRFRQDDASARPYLVRSLKVELRDRNKPNRDVKLAGVLEGLRTRFAAKPDVLRALDGVAAMLAGQWGDDPAIAGFQKRAFDEILTAWHGDGSTQIVISADTGSGKTEAACLPMITAAAADRLAGMQGTRAVIAYPRVRLAANQAQRLTKYLAALNAIDGMPLLTIGLQVAAVPRRFDRLHADDVARGWRTAAPGKLDFPFFGCPECEAPLLLDIAAGEEGADRLDCLGCGWRFNGWVGSKAGLMQAPPAFFLPTTDSLHQWMHNPDYGRIFGDQPGFAAPRAVLADEIHLFSHIHGAQVGHAFRRLIHRATVNAGGMAPLAIGMSATLGDPAMAWGRLIGNDAVTAIRPLPTESDTNPRGREYFFFIQPEVESRGSDIAGASTTIQSVMCLAHGMRRRTGKAGGYRSLVFLDSIDKLRRMHSAFVDAEEEQNLFALRTERYPDDPVTGTPQRECCRQPHGCDRFEDGECWFFAATDKFQITTHGALQPGSPLQVANQPISSATEGKVDALIKSSDILFATSSLEVGFDDPDMTMVFQHYAPQSLASFIQRKGRGGRGIDDRPMTGVTLSLYSPRDSWWFNHPREMIEPPSFDVPINPDNHFVVRGQVLATMLDGLAAYASRTGAPALDLQGKPTQAALANAEAFVVDLFGADIADRLDLGSLAEFWEKAGANLAGADLDERRRIPDLRAALEWVPQRLFDTINLPELYARTGSAGEGKREDIMLGLAATAPGNVTRRFHPTEAYWLPPTNGRAPWLGADDFAAAERWPYQAGADALRAELPLEGRERVGDRLLPEFARPRQISLEKLGFFVGADWQTRWICEVTGEGPVIRHSEDLQLRPRRISHESRGVLRGFPIVAAKVDKGRTLDLGGAETWLKNLSTYVGDGLGRANSGLAVLRLYWGADSEIRVEDRREDPVVFSQTFTAPGTDDTLLHGFHVSTEGVQFRLDSARLDAFVAEERVRLADAAPDRRWFMNQWMRHLVEARARAIGMNGYEAQRGAELFAAAAGEPTLRKRLNTLLSYWDADDLAALFEDTRATLLSQHPLLSARRVQRVAAALGSFAFRDMFKAVLAEMKDDQAFSGYLRTLVLHSIAQRLKLGFLLSGGGDDRRVVSHVKLPVQFGAEIPTESADVITIAELGELGDGTTRAFEANLTNFAQLLTEGFLTRCPAAEEDALAARFFASPAEHASWRAMDPTRADHLAEIAHALGRADGRLPAAMIRTLFGHEEIGANQFALYDLATEIEQVVATLFTRGGREPTAWEVTSAAVGQAEAGSGELGRLLEAYRGVDHANLDDSLSPEMRLADQVYRLAARQCVDGCRACLHLESDLMTQSLMASSVSRRLLTRFLEKPDV
ncbi:AAA domain-containing protein [Sphingomonas qomolangmaensis]|uniref:AAA domain-containing protein n=1 Tax=Sphingomonas qomolangmaensis TaxID=2918765 RepID=A0ABY5L8Q6_9SPHN|nr:AAA domain-containing protein [Sphingomonas qomolangmaensis]UUL82536.1 AAA domain-containing protein [Sphingomonas qomolangmaensis]